MVDVAKIGPSSCGIVIFVVAITCSEPSNSIELVFSAEDHERNYFLVNKNSFKKTELIQSHKKITLFTYFANPCSAVRCAVSVSIQRMTYSMLLSMGNVF